MVLFTFWFVRVYILDVHGFGFWKNNLPGWQLLSVGSREVATKHELLGLPHRSGWWWVKFGDSESAKVKVSKAEAAVARFITVVNEHWDCRC